MPLKAMAAKAMKAMKAMKVQNVMKKKPQQKTRKTMKAMKVRNRKKAQNNNTAGTVAGTTGYYKQWKAIDWYQGPGGAWWKRETPPVHMIW